jgi:formylglycine-generating enzyme required for sulfatase activity
MRTKGQLAKDEAIALPNEAQWEWAARWNKESRRADDRRYPWGGEAENDLDQRCNMGTTGIGHTSAVGLFPSGNAGCGAADMSGNVWEWCANWYDKEQKYHVLRGGSWCDVSPVSLRCAYRIYVTPDYRIQLYGFRCVLGLGGSAPG